MLFDHSVDPDENYNIASINSALCDELSKLLHSGSTTQSTLNCRHAWKEVVDTGNDNYPYSILPAFVNMSVYNNPNYPGSGYPPTSPNAWFDLHGVIVSRTRIEDDIKIHVNNSGTLTVILKSLSGDTLHTYLNQSVTAGEDIDVPLSGIPASIKSPGLYNLELKLGPTTKHLTVVHQ
jgi:hypothetical protein